MKLFLIFARLWLLASINAIAPSLKVKSLDAISAKWSQRASAAGQAYTDGVRSPKNDWASSTVAAVNNWSAGVQAAIQNKSFERGVTTAGDAAWQQGAINKGAQRYAPGVQAAQPKFAAGFQKFAQVLTNLQLPPRMPKGDPGNYQRAQAVGTALRNAKLGK
jgi:hypothetical protein